jgi:hypothetical protein
MFFFEFHLLLTSFIRSSVWVWMIVEELKLDSGWTLLDYLILMWGIPVLFIMGSTFLLLRSAISRSVHLWIMICRTWRFPYSYQLFLHRRNMLLWGSSRLMLEDLSESGLRSWTEGLGSYILIIFTRRPCCALQESQHSLLNLERMELSQISLLGGERRVLSESEGRVTTWQ